MTAAPRLITDLLNARVTWFLTRLALVAAYLLGGIVKLADWPAAVAEQAHFGMQPASLWAAVTIAVELIGPTLILTGRFVWFGAGMLGVFTLCAAITANAFWSMPEGPDRFMATNTFFEHIGLVGGFALVAIVGNRSRSA